MRCTSSTVFAMGGHYVDLSALDLRGALVRWLEQISHYLLSWGTHFLSNIVSFFVEAIIAFFTLFFCSGKASH